MSIEDMAEMIGRAHGAALDGLTRTLWAGVAAGEVGDDDAARLAEAIQARRGSSHAARAMVGSAGFPGIGGAVGFSDSGNASKSGPISRRKLQRPLNARWPSSAAAGSPRPV